VGLDIFEPGAYTVQGDLYDSLGKFVGRATWSGADSTASLRFDELPGTVGPYTLREIYLLDGDGEIIDSMVEVYTTQQVVEADLGTHIVRQTRSEGVGLQGILPGGYADSGVDLDGDGLYDLLVVEAQVEMEEAGRYRLEGWLEGAGGTLISWAAGDPISVTVVGTHTLSLAFSGPAIHAHNTAGPFTLMALKLLKGDGYEVVDEVDVAYTTSAYTRDQFESLPQLELPADHVILFADHMEDGEGSWTADAPWTLTTAQYHSPAHAWSDSPGGNYANNIEVSLTTLSIDLRGFGRPTLQLQTCYDLETDYDYGYVEISTNQGGTWTNAAAYTGRTAHWSHQVVDLGVLAGAETLWVRFRLDTDAYVTADGWCIDDVVIYFDSDLDDDGIPNDVEAGDDPTQPVDTDGDGMPDYQDADSDDDGIPDAVEASDDPTQPVDTDGDGMPDYQDVDSDDDGISDAVEVGDDPTQPVDTDGDGMFDYQDGDSDNDRILDASEYDDDQDVSNADDFCTNVNVDQDDDGIPNCQDNDVDADTIPNYRDSDSDGDSIPDIVEAGDGDPGTPPVDSDGDGLSNFVDLDSDNDDKPDDIEGTGDSDGDGIPNYVDPEFTWFFPIVFR
jgi:hypothetical protein